MKKVLFTILFLFTFSFSGERSWSRSKTIGEILKKIEKTSVKKQKSVLPKVKYQRVKQKKINLKAIKPPSTRKLYGEESGDEAELEKTLDMEIRQLYKLVKRYKRSRKRGELWLRLAELYVERARLIEFRLQNEYDKKLALYHVGKLKRKPRLNLKPAQEFNLKAISLYESYLKIFSKSKKIDQALFFLGYNYFQMNQVKKGERYYQQLIEKFPKSPYVTEAHFALGEFYFENEKWNLAKNNYKKVILNRKSRLYPLALYKYAWCQYKVGNTSEALKSLERVVVEGQKSKGSSSRQNIHLVSEAINDLIMFYADARSYKSARSYFKRFMNARQLNKTIEKLAYLYMSRDDREAARYLFKDLISQDPTSEKAFDYQYQIVNMYVSVGDSKEFKRELLYWIDRFSPDSIWSKVNRKNKDLLKKSYKIMELTLRNYVLQKHQTAQNSRAPHAQKLAQAAYELYFNTFTQSPKIDEMHFFYAELLFDMKKYRKAAYHYLWVNKKTPQSSYAKQALINALLALEKELPSPYEIKKVVGNSKEPIEFDRSVLDFLKVAKEYLKKFPKEKNSIAVQYKVAVMNYYYNHFDEALKGFESVIKKAPKSKYASYSANLMLDVYNIRKDFVGLEKAAKMILSIPAIASSSVGMQIQSIQQKTSFAIAHQLEKEKKFLEAAKAYEKLLKENPRSPLAVSAAYNAAVNYERSNNLLKALEHYAYVKKYASGKQASLGRNARKFMAILYEKTGQYVKAARSFESYAAYNTKDRVASEFYYNAALIWNGINWYSKALRDFQKYLLLSRGKKKSEVLFLIGSIWEKRRNYSKAIYYFEKYMKSSPQNRLRVIETAFKLGSLYEKLKRKSQAQDWYRKTVLIQRNISRRSRVPVGVNYAAEAKFKLVYKTFEKLRSIRFPRSSSGQARALNKKLSFIQRLKNELKPVIAYDDGPMIVAALTLQGQAFQDLSVSLIKAPIPKEVPKSIRKQYKDSVRKKASEFLSKATESYKVAIQKAYQIDAYGPWLKIAQRELGRINGNKFYDLGFLILEKDIPIGVNQ